MDRASSRLAGDPSWAWTRIRLALRLAQGEQVFNPFDLLEAAPDDPWLSKSEVIDCSYCVNAFVLKTRDIVSANDLRDDTDRARLDAGEVFDRQIRMEATAATTSDATAMGVRADAGSNQLVTSDESFTDPRSRHS